MTNQPLKKNKITLSDYSFQKDIDYRTKLSELSTFEVELLNEILESSLTVSAVTLADYLEADITDVLQTLERLKDLNLYKIDGATLHVDKEMRKYYEFQLEKFNDNFRGDLEFLKGLLSKVPIHVLPNWYAIPRTSDDIFQSIVEKHFLSPKLYERYMRDLVFDDPVINKIKDDLFSSPGLKLKAKEVMETYNIKREKFEEYILLLEFNLVCFLSYNQNNNHWEEVITPFHEWRQYHDFLEEYTPHPIEDVSEVLRDHPHDFGFLEDLTRLLTEALQAPLKIDDLSPYQQKLINRAIQLKLADIEGERFFTKETARLWVEKPLKEQAINLYRYSASDSLSLGFGNVNRDLLEIEKALSPFKDYGWIYFDNFIKVCNAAIGENRPVTLEKKGRRWHYIFPKYSKEDIAATHHFIFEVLFQSGFVATGSCHGEKCFCLTPFGKETIG